MSISAEHYLTEAHANTDRWRAYHHSRVNPLRVLLGEAVEFLEAARYDDSATSDLARELVEKINACLETYTLTPDAN